ncbi:MULTISPECIES: DNA polymerase III subunit gamma/tau [unclassified Sphingopyxis]|uniref:DNA polymerase III subunit gamma/tau n=1 Tax=unclassified Sphingopyxis TaxID=2614943 RepID=UPI000731CC22|nr:MULTISPECIES: DNA polymerase III subunit gamma/tau [unclassified Sphingopyxis]KTE24550.1 DNA polymerase III subunit gamma/tau [Sphingopyxis sp. H057]KTE51016.1 DNA polymerase III subunit gamma/tau [Sphingopyxis sp. H071]KTE52234.1 DNA polymerase III subunit gamma/tau [Sphingopyxis sp. H073]KTE59755.1 DNA polymerase III subunit gamma/tau [Sphingopyxis sp. H107]KTE62282.1 DNA polymerase III subunit gamma/tau [Sphingopyxis sp. H100]
MFAAAGVDAPETPPPASSGPYRVLARKYRPQTFAELIGQDAMVKTLANAIARDRLAHAFLMTGVRGVGKTSTARLIAKALNCIGPDGQGGPTIDPCGVCEPCRAITEGRHIDVIEMDAASNTGVDDVREIIEAVRYAAVSARYKIYIIDEVHMLSRNAFNALLKTLEEPPPHVKFLFATTEVNKVPVTVLSRCQRFDLRRITPDMLFAHFSSILQKEGVEAEAPAIWLIANAAEGSVRDGLSILDQAIAYADLDGGGRIGADQVRTMLGLSDRTAITQLMATILEGDSGGAIDLARAQYALGIEPVAMVRGLMDLTHAITLAKVSRHDDPALAASDRERIGDWAQKLGFAPLNRLWQLLLKGHDEVLRANNPLEHLEMLLLRVIYAASMPDPGELAKLLESGGVPAMPLGAPPAPTGRESAAVEPVAEASAPESAETPVSALTIAQIHQLLESTGNHQLARQVYDDLKLLELEPGRLVYAPTAALDGDFARRLGETLLAQTGSRWQVRVGEGEGRPSLGQMRAAKLADNDSRIRELPVVKAALAAFPDARLVEDDHNHQRFNP